MTAQTLLGKLGCGIDNLSKIKLTDKKVMEFMKDFFSVGNDLSDAQRKNNSRMLDNRKAR